MAGMKGKGLAVGEKWLMVEDGEGLMEKLGRFGRG